jgi:valyl-tRNA synthetase
VVSREMPEVCPDCGGTAFRQDEDVLDTWFSSALWPFSTLGWPDKTPDLEYFYPTNVLVTGYDIIFFWVVRMVFSGIECMGEVPFDKVLIHGLVRAADGKKMSKSLGNGVDPLDVIDQYGADALRFMLATGNSPGNDLKFQLERVEASRNFANKLWNASRFVLMGLESDPGELDGTETLTLADRWILSRLSDLTQEATDNLEKFELGVAANKLYEFVWNEYCDWYIETAKRRLYGEDPDAKRSVQRVLLHVLKDILKLLHPFMPYITEEIWQHLSDSSGDLIVAEWPAADLSRRDPEAERTMEILMDAIRSIRNSRAEMDVVPSRKARLIVKVAPELQAVFLDQKTYLESLASASEVRAFVEGETIEDAVSVVVPGGELLMPLDDLIDYNKEAERLEREVRKWSGEIERIDSKLNNPGFVAKAPVQLVEEERAKRITLVEMLSTSSERLDKVKTKLK